MDKATTSNPVHIFPKCKITDGTNKERNTLPSLPGFTLIQNYVSDAEETNLWNDLDKLPWVVDFSRKLQYYGYRNERTKPYHLVPIKEEIPDCMDFLTNKIMEDKLVFKTPDQVIINDYEPGQGIKPHFDRKDYFNNTIIGVSLGSDCLMEFTHVKEGNKVSVFIPRKSLYILEDEARYDWHHGIPGRKTDKLGNGNVLTRKRRISITYRNVIQDKVKKTGVVHEMASKLFKLIS